MTHCIVRFIYMDYIFFATLKGTEYARVVVSYDIACQWSKTLWERMRFLDPQMHLNESQIPHVSFLVPKFHLPAHILLCQRTFSFNFTRGVGRTEGKVVERNWALTNPLAASTRKMGPGSWRDTINDFFNDMNHQKYVKLRKYTLSSTI